MTTMTKYDCPSWCTTTPEDHAGDDPGRLMHDGPRIGDALVGKIGDEPTYVYLAVDEHYSAPGLRSLAADIIAAAEWLEANQ